VAVNNKSFLQFNTHHIGKIPENNIFL
jgi:hypothetical protein